MDIHGHGYIASRTEAGKAWVSRPAKAAVCQIDGVIFDVDGVLIDVRESIQLAHGMVAERYFTHLGWTDCADMISPSEVDAFKLARGFNSDWNLANAWVLLYLLKSMRYGSTCGRDLRPMPRTIEEFTARVAGLGGGLGNAKKVLEDLATPGEWEKLASWADRALLEKVFQETYSGDLCPEVYGFEPSVGGPGLILKDKCLLDRQSVPQGLKLGVATGRTLGETVVGLRLMGLSDQFPASTFVTENDRVWKPDPAILRLAVERTGCRRPMYVGDTPDDLTTVDNYRAARGSIVSCAVLTGVQDDGLQSIFMDQGADLIADNVNAALLAVKELMGGASCPTEKRK